MKLRYFYCALASLAVFVSCELEDQPGSITPKGDVIKFSKVNTASASPFKEGSTIGLFVGDPVNVDNAKFTVEADGSLKCDTEVKWGLMQKSASDFLAYSPFDSSYKSQKNIDFSVAADQTDSVSYVASDLLVAVTSAAPSDGAINFTFDHKMVKFCLYFSIYSKETVKSVEICDVYTTAGLSLTNGSVVAKGDKGSVKAGKVTGDAGKEFYVGLVVPQTAKPTIKVTMSSDKVFEFPLDAEKTFKSGEQWNNEKAPIYIETEQKPVELSFSVSDWSDGGTLVFSGSEEEEDDDDDDDDTTYTSIADLVATATSDETSFSVTLKDVVVTKVTGKYAHLQDSKAGIMFYNKTNPFSDGDCINGAVTGKIKLYQGYAEITSIDLSDATVTTVAIPDPVEVTISELNSNIAAYFNRMVIVKGVEVTSGISASEQTGSISQAGSSINLFNKNKEAVIEKGSYGNIIGWPVTNNSTKQILVYTNDSFEEAGSGEETAFTAISVPGVYDISNADAPAAVSAAGTYDQTGFAKTSSKISFNFFNFNDGWGVFETLSATSFSVGGSVSLTLATIGSTGVTAGTYSVTVAAKNSKLVWLKDTTNNRGYIVPIQ